MKLVNHRYLLLAFIVSITVGGCGFSADSQSGRSGEGAALQAQGWAPGIPNLDSGPEMAFSPQIAVEGDPANNGGADDNQSSAIAVWVKLEDPDPFDANPQQVYRLYAAYYNGATGWGAPQVIDAGSANYFSAGAPKIAMDDIGNAVVVWEQSDGTAERIYERRYVAGTGWRTTDAGCPFGIPDATGDDGICLLDSGVGAASPSVAVEPDGGGTAMVAYTRRTGAAGADAGVATGGAATTLTDSSKSWTPNQWVGATVTITGGTGAGQSGTIVSNTATVLTVVTAWGTNPAAGSTYAVTGQGTFRAYSRRLTGGISAGTWGAETNIDTSSCCTSFSTVHSGGTDGGDNVGKWTSTAIGTNGNVHMSYYAVNGVAGVSGGPDTSNTTNLRYAFNLQTVCVDGGVGCANATDADVGSYTSLVVDSTGRVFISYYDATNLDLKYATCGGDCLHLNSGTGLPDNWTTVCVDGTAGTCVATGATTISAGAFTSMAQDPTGRLHLVYQNASTTGVRYTTCLPASGNSFCTAVNSWSTPAQLPGSPGTATYMSLAISASATAGSPGVLHVAYQSAVFLRYYTCDITSSGTNCANAAQWNNPPLQIFTPGINTAWISLKAGPSSTGGALGRLHLVFFNTATTKLTYTTCDLTTNANCVTAANWTPIVAADQGLFNTGQYAGLAIDGSGRLHVSYYDATFKNLKYATCVAGGAATCAAGANWTAVCLEGDAAGCLSPYAFIWDTGQYTSIAADNFGEVAIAYYEPQALGAATSGLRLRLATSLGRSASSPSLAMDSAGNVVAALTREVLVGCAALAKVNTTTAAGTDNPDNNGFNSELSHAGCYPSVPVVNKFDAATSAWLGAFSINPNSPTQASDQNGNTANICFQEGFVEVGGGAQAQNVVGLNSSCVNFTQLHAAMDRAGNASVVMKLTWNEQESANGCSLGTSGHGGVAGGPNDDPLNAQPNQCAPTDVAWDEWNGNAIAAERYAAGAAWVVGSWSNTFLYAHSNQPSDAAADPANVAVAVISNCPSYYIDNGGDPTTNGETNRALLNCRVNAPQIAISGDANGTTLAVWERFDGTNYDVYADCYDTSGTICDANPAGWRSSFTAPAAGSITPKVTTPYFVLNNTATSRTAFSPQVAMDSTGNGLAVWTERDGNQWRVYGMRFQSGAGFVVGSRTPIDALGSDSSCTSGNCFYANPVLGMEWIHLDGVGHTAGLCGGIASCGDGMTLMLDIELYGGALLPPVLNVRVQSHQWTPP
jgi:hypothetical protein